MGIAPIDLQAIFTQVDKVGRSQAAQNEGHTMAKAIQGNEIQKKTEELLNQVNETQNTGEGPEKVNDHSHRNDHGRKNNKRKEDEEETAEKDNRYVLRDPSLGNKIDISL